MMKLLRKEQIKNYRDDGFVSPVAVFDQREIENYRACLEQAPQYPSGLRVGQKLYLLHTWAAELASHPRLLDSVEDVLGPDILCWGMKTFFKEPMTESYVSWHQDSAHWGFQEPDKVVSAWVALTTVNRRNGCLKMVRSSHFVGGLPHADTYAHDNLLTRGQEVGGAIDQDKVVHVLLKPGEVSLHHIHTIHSSDANRSDQHRLGVAIRYVAPQARRIGQPGDSAWLVRGRDESKYFRHEKPPVSDLDARALAEHAESMKFRLGLGQGRRRYLEGGSHQPPAQSLTD